MQKQYMSRLKYKNQPNIKIYKKEEEEDLSQFCQVDELDVVENQQHEFSINQLRSVTLSLLYLKSYFQFASLIHPHVCYFYFQKKKKKINRIKCMEKQGTKDEVGRTPSNLVLGSITYCSLLVKRQHRKASFYCLACWLLFPHDHVATLPRMSTSS